MGAETERDVFDANSGHCLAYWLDSNNIDHYHIHMIETCACVALVLMILVYLQCKKWNMKKFYYTSLIAIPLDDTTSIITNQEPLLNNKQPQQYKSNVFSG